MGKEFSETLEDGSEVKIPVNEIIGESWEIADMGTEDSPVKDGFLAGNTISELMETYMERLVGEDVFDWYGTRFPLLIKFLDIEGKLSVQVHPDDEIGAERYDSLGKKEIWYILDAEPDAKVYMGFKQDTSATEFYNACKAGTADTLLNVIRPKKGDAILINPGTVHAAEGGIRVCEIQESSDLTFRLYDWGRENNPATARKMHLEEAIDLINYKKYNPEDYIPAKQGAADGTSAELLADCPQFTVHKLVLDTGMQVSAEDADNFIVYCCIEGEVSLQMACEDGAVRETRLCKGDTVLVPAECPDYVLSPLEKGSVLIESTVRSREDLDSYTGEPAEKSYEAEQ